MTAVRTRARSTAPSRRGPAPRTTSTRSTSTRSTSTRSTSTRSTSTRSTSAGRSRARGARADSSRSAVRSLPQETTGPRLQVLSRRRIGGRTLLGLSAALFFVVLAGAVTIQAQRIEAQHRIDRLDAALLQADERHRVLRAEVAVAESPEVVMQAAKELGMVEPGPVLPLVPPVPEDPSSPTATIESAPTGGDGAPVALGAAPDEPIDEKVSAGGG